MNLLQISPLLLLAIVKEIVTKYRLASRKKKEKKEKRRRRSILALSKWALAEFKNRKEKKGVRASAQKSSLTRAYFDRNPLIIILLFLLCSVQPKQRRYSTLLCVRACNSYIVFVYQTLKNIQICKKKLDSKTVSTAQC